MYGRGDTFKGFQEIYLIEHPLQVIKNCFQIRFMAVSKVRRYRLKSDLFAINTPRLFWAGQIVRLGTINGQHFPESLQVNYW